MMPLGPREYEQIVLDMLAFKCGVIVGPLTRQRTTVNAWLEPTTNDLCLELRTLIAGTRYEPVVQQGHSHVRVPTSWWQHFKATYRNRWWLRALVRRRPVRYIHHYGRLEVTVQGAHIWPQAALNLPPYMGNAVPVVIARDYEESWWTRGSQPAP